MATGERVRVARTTTHGEAETVALGRRVGEALQAGDRVLLIGDLGAGKTRFAKGVALGLGVPPEHRVTSQTFTLGGVLPGRVPVYHYDAYRVSPAALLEWGEEGLDDDRGVAIVEWGGGLRRRLAEPVLFVRLTIRGESERLVRFYARSSRFEPLLARISEAG